MKRTLKAVRVHNTQTNIKLEELLKEIIENQLDEKLEEMYNRDQADTATQISIPERRVA